jgi:hypothetical protein
MSGRIAPAVRAMEQAGSPSNSFATMILQLTGIGLRAVLRQCRSIVFKTLVVPVGAVTDALSSSR